VVLSAVLILALPAQAHSGEELNEWMIEWVTQADESLSPDHIAAYHDMVERHPFYFDPPPPPVVQPRRAHWNGTVEQWRPLVAQHFASNKVETAMCLIHYETGGTGNPDSKNTRSTAAGLFQFLRGTWDGIPRSVTGGSYDSGQVYQPEANVRSAAWLQNAYGWSQWSPYKNGFCRGL